MVQLVEVVKSSLRYELREVFVNPRHVVMLREDHVTKKTINEKKMIVICTAHEGESQGRIFIRVVCSKLTDKTTNWLVFENGERTGCIQISWC